jgi:CheY-like chemotaxis protein
VLVDAGYEVDDAAAPAEALALAADRDFDLLLTDVVMPAMNGRDLLARLRDGSPGLRVLYTSGYSGEAVTGRGVLDAGAPFLQKPFTREALCRKVREALEG